MFKECINHLLLTVKKTKIKKKRRGMVYYLNICHPKRTGK